MWLSDMINLGERLRKIRADEEAAVRAAEAARVRAVYEKQERERKQIRDFWYDYVTYVTNQINRGREPVPRKVTGVFEQRGNKNCYLITHELHTHHDVWQEMVAGAQKLGLVVKLSHAHDGMGMESWYEIHVEPA
jgi:hypothetical protein